VSDEQAAPRPRAPRAKAPTEKPAAKPRAAKRAAPATDEPMSTAEAVAPEAPAQEAGTPEPAAPEGTPSRGKRTAGGFERPAYIGLRQRYHDEVQPALQREFGYANPMQVPRVEKVIVNIGLGEAIQNAKAVDAAVGDLAIITGQRPIVTRAKRSIAQFRLRTGMPIGAKVTLRGQRMYDFLERTLSLALPRIRDFRGIPTRSFDGRGNFSLGLREQLVYPEIDYDKIDRLRGLEVSIVTTARTDEEGRKLLQLLGMPFQAT
jgi:large subunit ribosomal protein L5